MYKSKIINDPVYGFISIPQDIIFRLIEHPWFQRLRRIKQLGLTDWVYPGALHTRFQHAIGAFHLLSMAIDNLRSKGIEITEAEHEAVSIAALLHDIGHGPFSHAMEGVIIKNLRHEAITLLMMQELNAQFNGKLSLAIAIFQGNYHRKFLHQLIAGQLDVDRLDYLHRDSFYTGVIEGSVGVDRIIQMMDVKNDSLIVDSKGIYSIEKFLLARRLMYWQVYLHKTALAAESLLIQIFRRVHDLSQRKENLFATPTLSYFLQKNVTLRQLQSDSKSLSTFALLDDIDVLASVKTWMNHSDKVLAMLCTRLMNRHLLKVAFGNSPWPDVLIEQLRQTYAKKKNYTPEESSYFIFSGEIDNTAYAADDIRINIQMKDGSIKDIAGLSEQYDLEMLSRKITKYYLCYPAVLFSQIKEYEDKR